MAEQGKPPFAIDLDEASRLTGLSTDALKEGIKRGSLEAVQWNGQAMIPLAELERQRLYRPASNSGGPAPAAAAQQPPPAAAETRPLPDPPTSGPWYWWYEYPWLRIATAAALVALTALVIWLLFIRSTSNGGGVTAGGGPVEGTEADLIALSSALHIPVYWAGDVPGTKLEITETTEGYTFVRYLPGNVPIGDPSPNFLTVATYPVANGWHDLRSYARHTNGETKAMNDGGHAMKVPGHQNSVFLAYANQPVQVEVYDPHEKHAWQLVKQGVVRPAGTTAPGQVVP